MAIAETENKPLVVIDQDGPCAVLTMSRPDKYNALNSAMRAALSEALGEVASNSAVRGVIITGGSKVFVAGADIKEFLTRKPMESFAPLSSMPDVWGQIASLRIPTIAAIAGLALGGGLELALACDMRIAAEGAKLGQPEVSLGLIPGRGGTQRLPRLIGMTRAKEMVLTGRQIDAQEALAWGLVNKVTTADNLLAEAKNYISIIASKPPLSVALGKLMLDRGEDASLETALTMESLAFANMFSTTDMKEGIDAFLNRRKPNFIGS